MRPPAFTISTITYKVVVVYALAERADTLNLFLFYPLYVLWATLCTGIHAKMSLQHVIIIVKLTTCRTGSKSRLLYFGLRGPHSVSLVHCTLYQYMLLSPSDHHTNAVISIATRSSIKAPSAPRSTLIFVTSLKVIKSRAVNKCH